jgi:hypothetical protein
MTLTTTRVSQRDEGVVTHPDDLPPTDPQPERRQWIARVLGPIMGSGAHTRDASSRSGGSFGV